MFEEQRFEVISKQKKVRKKGLKIARIEITMLKKKIKKKKNLRIVVLLIHGSFIQGPLGRHSR